MVTRRPVESGEVSDEFWLRVEPLIPVRERSTDKANVRKAGAGRPPKPARKVFEAVMYVCALAANERRCPKSALAVQVRCTSASWSGVDPLR